MNEWEMLNFSVTEVYSVDYSIIWHAFCIHAFVYHVS